MDFKNMAVVQQQPAMHITEAALQVLQGIAAIAVAGTFHMGSLTA